MIVLMIAKWVGDLFNEGLYDSHIDLAEVIFIVTNNTFKPTADSYFV